MTCMSTLEGSLSARAQAAAEAHLARCAACRQRLAQEQQVGQALHKIFRRATEQLELPPSLSRRVLTALAQEHVGDQEAQGPLPWWRRLAWALPAAACLLLILGGWAWLLRGTGPGTARSQQHLAERVLSAHFSYIVPSYTFRQEGDFVVDALTYQTNVVDRTVQTELARGD